VSLYGYPRDPEPMDDDESSPPAPGTYAGTGVIPAQRPAVVSEPVSSAESSGRHRTARPETNGNGPEFAWLRPPPERPGFGPSPTMGQPTVFGPSPAMGQPLVPAPAPVPAAPVSAALASPAPVQAPRVVRAAPEPTARVSAPPSETEAALAALLDEPDVQPWDRRPLLVVIASVIVLVLIGIAAGVVSASVVDPPDGVTGVSWRDADSGTTQGAS
jgi:hypothetical protein